MGITGAEARQEIVDELGAAIAQLTLATNAIGEAFELVSVTAQDRLEEMLFMPAQKGLGRIKRAQKGFAEANGLDASEQPVPSAGPPSQGARGFVEKAAEGARQAEYHLSDLQDSTYWIEFGDAELRAAVAEARERIGTVPGAATEFLRTLGR